MCFLAIVYKVIPEYSVVVAANRDEFLHRQGTEPCLIKEGIWAAKDKKEGGTWLGVNRSGLLVGLTNRYSERPLAGKARSRGLLCLDALSFSGVEKIPEFIEKETSSRVYNPFNIFYALKKEAYISYYDCEVETKEIEPGIHILSNRQLDRPSSPKIQKGFELLGNLKSLTIEKTVESLKRVCADHQPGIPPQHQICVHGKDFGTLSSSLIAVNDRSIKDSIYLHAQGNPCSSNYKDYSFLFGKDL